MKKFHKILLENRIGYLCTESSSKPHITPVFFLYDPFDFKIYFITDKNSKKVKNIEKNKRVSMTVDVRDEENPFNNEGVMIEGEAEVVEFLDTNIPLFEKIFEKFREKYYSLISKERGEHEILVKINTKKMIYWRGSRFERVEFQPKIS